MRKRCITALLCTCLVLINLGCSTASFKSVTPTLDSFDPFYVPLDVNSSGVATVTVESSVGPLELILDTGADQAVLIRTDAAIIDELKQTGSQWKFSASGSLRNAPTYQIDEVVIGPLRFNGVVAVAEDSALPGFMPGDGVLGRGLLDGLTLDVDLPARRLGVLPAGTVPTDMNGELWISAPAVSLENGPVVHVRLDDSKVTRAMVLDTGAIALGDGGMFAVVELPEDLDPHRTATDNLPVYDAHVVHMGDGAIGPMSFYVVEYNQPPGTHGFLGNAFFATHRVVIDPSSNRVFIHPTGD